MNWLIQFETADGLKAPEIMDLGTSHPPQSIRRPVRIIRRPILKQSKEQDRASFRTYELRGMEPSKAKAYYKELG